MFCTCKRRQSKRNMPFLGSKQQQGLCVFIAVSARLFRIVSVSFFCYFFIDKNFTLIVLLL